MSATYPPMVVAAARVLCRRGAEQCHVDFDDSWKLYGEDYLQDAKQALDAAGAPELLEALRRLEVAANTVAYCHDRHRGNFAAALSEMESDAEAARAAIAKVTGSES